MQRLLPLGTAFVLVLTACGAGHKPAPRVTKTETHARPTVKAVAAAREREAGRKAEKLLERVLLPSGARPSTSIPSPLRTDNLGVSVITEFAYRHRVWKTREPVAALTSFVKKHALPGFENHIGGESPVWLGYDQRLAGGWPMQRMYSVALVRHAGWTFVRVDAAVAWIYPRSSREVVPPGVRRIDIHGAGVNWRVVDPGQVSRIVRWFDALNVTPPGVVVSCVASLSTQVRFAFRSGSGAKLASAVVPSEPADGCNPIQFTIGGKEQKPLGDARFGRYSFVNRVQRLLGVCFRDPRRACR